MDNLRTLTHATHCIDGYRVLPPTIDQAKALTMLYADLDVKMYPPGWEEAEYLAKQLKQVAWGYQMVVQKKMFAGTSGPDHKFAIIRWGMRESINDSAKRNVVWEGVEFSELTGMLRLLIATETAQAQESKEIRAWMP